MPLSWDELQQLYQKVMQPADPMTALSKASTIGPTEASRAMQPLPKGPTIGPNPPEVMGAMPLAPGDIESAIGLAKGLSRSEFASELLKNPNIADLLDRRQSPAGKLPTDVSERRYSELMKTFGGTQEPMVDLEHRSSVPDLTTLDPSKYGTGQAGEEASRALSNADFKKRTYLTEKGSKVEPRFSNLPVWDAQVPASAIYDLESDPQGLIPQAQQKGGDVRTTFENLVLQKGYKGYKARGQVAYFEPLPVTKRP